MAVSGDLIVPRIAGNRWLYDQPLYHWVALAFGKLFGSFVEFHAAARLASGVFIGVRSCSSTARAPLERPRAQSHDAVAHFSCCSAASAAGAFARGAAGARRARRDVRRARHAAVRLARSAGAGAAFGSRSASRSSRRAGWRRSRSRSPWCWRTSFAPNGAHRAPPCSSALPRSSPC